MTFANTRYFTILIFLARREDFLVGQAFRLSPMAVAAQVGQAIRLPSLAFRASGMRRALVGSVRPSRIGYRTSEVVTQ
jgi:hypothetical protein